MRAMHFSQKLGLFLLSTVVVLAPCVVNADTIVTSQTYVNNYALQKPASADAGKVLMYAPDAQNVTTNTQPVAQYVRVPVMRTDGGDPNANNAGDPTDFASIWVE